MVRNGAFAAARDKGHVGHAGIIGFFHPVLHQGLVDDRHHFLGHGLGGGQEAGAVAGDGKQTFFNHDTPEDSLYYKLTSSVPNNGAIRQLACSLQCSLQDRTESPKKEAVAQYFCQ